MRNKIRKVCIGTGLAAIVGISSLLFNNQPNNVLNKDVFFPPTQIIDKNEDGEADEVKYFMIGNRISHIFYREPTQQEKDIYRNRKN